MANPHTVHEVTQSKFLTNLKFRHITIGPGAA